MGLDTTHGCWHGAYSAFARWRNELARVAGYEMFDDDYGPTYWNPRWEELPGLFYEPKYKPADPVGDFGNDWEALEAAEQAAWQAVNSDEFKKWKETKIAGHWDTPPDDPLLVLLIHSDADGYIYPAQGQFLARRLEQLLPLLPDEPAAGHIGHWRNKTQQFIDGLDKAAANNEIVEFH